MLLHQQSCVIFCLLVTFCCRRCLPCDHHWWVNLLVVWQENLFSIFLFILVFHTLVYSCIEYSCLFSFWIKLESSFSNNWDEQWTLDWVNSSGQHWCWISRNPNRGEGVFNYLETSAMSSRLSWGAGFQDSRPQGRDFGIWEIHLGLRHPLPGHLFGRQALTSAYHRAHSIYPTEIWNPPNFTETQGFPIFQAVKSLKKHPASSFPSNSIM